MRVTRFNYPLENSLIKKMDLIAERVSRIEGKKQDVLFNCEGAEGEGKTTMSIACAYYLAEQTGREFSDKNVYFDVNEFTPIFKSTENKIFIWDEPALQALSTDWAKKQITDLTRLLMMARKKRHILIVNMTKFFKFGEYLAVDRPKCLIHVYSRTETDSQQRFVYIKEKNLEPLWRDYRFKKIRNYKKYASKVCRGTFPDILNPSYKYNVLSEFNLESYERRKDAAIQMVGNEKVDGYMKPTQEKLIKLQHAFATYPYGKQGDKAKHLNIKGASLTRWKNLPKSYPKLFEKGGKYKEDP